MSIPEGKDRSFKGGEAVEWIMTYKNNFCLLREYLEKRVSCLTEKLHKLGSTYHQLGVRNVSFFSN